MLYSISIISSPTEGPSGYSPYVTTQNPNCFVTTAQNATYYFDVDIDYNPGGKNYVTQPYVDWIKIEEWDSYYGATPLPSYVTVTKTLVGNPNGYPQSGIGYYRRWKIVVSSNINAARQIFLKVSCAYGENGYAYKDQWNEIGKPLVKIGQVDGTKLKISGGLTSINCVANAGIFQAEQTDNFSIVRLGSTPQDELNITSWEIQPANPAFVITPQSNGTSVSVSTISPVVGTWKLVANFKWTRCRADLGIPIVTTYKAEKSITVVNNPVSNQTILTAPGTVCANQNLPEQVEGDPRLCTVEPVQYATQYEWRFERSNGTLIQTRLQGSSYFVPAQGPGSYLVKVTPINGCGRGTTAGQLIYYSTNAVVCGGGGGGVDPFRARPETGDAVVDIEDPQTLVFPNPASTELNVVVPKYIQVPATIQLVSPQGAIMVSKQSQERSNKLDVSTYPEGLYLVQVTDGNQVVSTKAFIKR